jgi:hypothetical protein
LTSAIGRACLGALLQEHHREGAQHGDGHRNHHQGQHLDVLGQR